MREILFKAKRIDNGEWVEGALIQSPYMGSIRSWISSPEDKTRLRAIATYYGDWRAVEVCTDTICQYTGLTDKNGCKIWENDVLLQKTTEMHWCKWECMGVVKYGEHDWDASNYGYTSIGFYVEPIVKKGDINKIACGINQVDINDEYYPIEVIGNIFDNTELLKGE